MLLNAHGVVGERLVIAGVDDPTGNGVPGHGTDLDAALAGVPDLPIVLLAHQPHLIATSRDRVDLQISGHTHGGQMWPFHYLVRLRERSCKGCRDTGIAPRCGPVGARATGATLPDLRSERDLAAHLLQRRPPEGTKRRPSGGRHGWGSVLGEEQIQLLAEGIHLGGRGRALLRRTVAGELL